VKAAAPQPNGRRRATLRESPSKAWHVLRLILRSLQQADRFYVGVTADLRARLRKHNAREVRHTSKYTPWTVKTYIAFSSEKQAFAFQKYLKSPSGRAFAKKRLRLVQVVSRNSSPRIK